MIDKLYRYDNGNILTIQSPDTDTLIAGSSNPVFGIGRVREHCGQYVAQFGYTYYEGQNTATGDKPLAGEPLYTNLAFPRFIPQYAHTFDNISEAEAWVIKWIHKDIERMRKIAEQNRQDTDRRSV